MKTGKIIKIFQMIGDYEGWEKDQILPKGW